MTNTLVHLGGLWTRHNMARRAALDYAAGMKIAIDTADLLILDDRPLVVAGVLLVALLVMIGIGIAQIAAGEVLVGLAFAVLGGGFAFGGMLVFVRRNQLVLDRAGGQVLMRRRTFLRYSEQRFALEQLERAVVQTSRSGDTDTHRMALVIGGAVHPFTAVYTSGRGARRGADAVNDWLARHGRPAVAS